MAHPTKEDLESLSRFWQWADNEKPTPQVFSEKAGKDGPMTEMAQEALDSAIGVVMTHVPDGAAVVTDTLRAAVKPLSLATLYSWMVLPEFPEQKKLSPNELAAAEQDFAVEAHHEAYAIKRKPEEKYVRFVKIPEDTKQEIVFASAKAHVCNRDKNLELAKNYGMGPQKLREVVTAQHRKWMQREAAQIDLSEVDSDESNFASRCGEVEKSIRMCLQALGVEDVKVTVDKQDGRCVFYHEERKDLIRIYGDYMTISSQIVKDMVSKVRADYGKYLDSCF